MDYNLCEFLKHDWHPLGENAIVRRKSAEGAREEEEHFVLNGMFCRLECAFSTLTCGFQFFPSQRLNIYEYN